MFGDLKLGGLQQWKNATNDKLSRVFYVNEEKNIKSFKIDEDKFTFRKRWQNFSVIFPRLLKIGFSRNIIRNPGWYLMNGRWKMIEYVRGMLK